MMSDAQITVRNAGLLVTQRGVNVLGGLVFAVLIPRLMGPSLFGRYALIASLSAGFADGSGLGLTQVIARYTPQFTLQKDGAGVRAFFGNLLAVRVLSGGLAATLCLVVTLLWLRDIEPGVLLLMAGAVFIRGVAHVVFAFFIGLNQVSRWGMGEVVRRWSLIGYLLMGFYLGGLWGACLGLLITELGVLLVGGWWAKSYLALSDLRPDPCQLVPYLKFGLVFFASDVVLIAFQRSGEALVRAFSGDYAQVSYFGLAYGGFLTAGVIIPQIVLAFTPLFASLRVQSQAEALRQWIERLIQWLAIGGVLAVFGVLLLGADLVPLVLGSAYLPVAPSLVPLSLALLAMALSSVAGVLALTCDRGKVALAAAGVRLATFWCFGPPLIGWWGSFGGCLALLLAYSFDAAYFTWRMRNVVRYSLQRWVLTVGLGGLFLPLIWFRSSWPANIALYVVFIAGYAGVLSLLRVVRLTELLAVWRAIGPRGRPLHPTL